MLLQSSRFAVSSFRAKTFLSRVYVSAFSRDRFIKQLYIQLKSIHCVNSSARSSLFEIHIILTKPFQSSQSWHQLSFYENKILVQNCLHNEWTLALQFQERRTLTHFPFTGALLLSRWTKNVVTSVFSNTGALVALICNKLFPWNIYANEAYIILIAWTSL